jgi:hypothetical protein
MKAGIIMWTMTQIARVIRLTIVAGIAAAPALAQQQVQVSAAGPTFRFLSGNLIGGNPVTGAPYSATAVTDVTQTLANGTHITQHSSATQYRDSQGRERREQVLTNLGPFTAQSNALQTVFISDPVAGVNYSLDPQNHTAVKLPVPALPPLPGGAATGDVFYHSITMQGGGQSIAAAALPAGSAGPVVIGGGPIATMAVGGAPGGPGPGPMMIMRNTLAGALETTGAAPDGAPPGAQPGVEQLGSKTLEGLSATGARTTITIPTGQIGNDGPIQITDERWYSPDLQVTVQSTHSDPRMGTVSYSLTNVSRAEPSPTLFQVPADYTLTDQPRGDEVCPSQKTQGSPLCP